MNRYVLCGSAFTSRDEAYRYMAELFDFPEGAGRNLDALWDLLHDKPGSEIEIADAREIPQNLGEYGMKMLDVFGDLQREEGFSVHIFW
ncbi:MAG: barstar family protein [Peptoniphilaceae bacterium]|nr:barstar family protein [Peptoniphilaceae bacterium]